MYTEAEGSGTVLSQAAEYLRDKWSAFLDAPRRIVDLQHRAALAAQAARARGDTITADAARAMIATLGELSQLHGRIQEHAQALAPYLGLGAIPVPVVAAAAFSAVAVAVLWWFRKLDLQEQLLRALEAGTLTEAGYLEAQGEVGEMPGPIGETLQAGVSGLKWLVLGLVAWLAFQAFQGSAAFRRPGRRNPPLVVFNENPPPGIMSRRVWSLAYRHEGDGADYIHEFRPGVALEAERDGTLSLYHKRGRPLWKDFPE